MWQLETCRWSQNGKSLVVGSRPTDISIVVGGRSTDIANVVGGRRAGGRWSQSWWSMVAYLHYCELLSIHKASVRLPLRSLSSLSFKYDELLSVSRRESNYLVECGASHSPHHKSPPFLGRKCYQHNHSFFLCTSTSPSSP